jgi:Na+-transporting NADH:ubiquinone oxidoreductase subunit NqrB
MRVPGLVKLDARYFQIGALACLLAINFLAIDFGAKPIASAFAMAASLLTQAAFSRFMNVPLDLRSPLITGLSFSLLLRADAAWMHAVAGVVAIASKFLLRTDGRHIFNPAGFAIVALLLAHAGVWISPGQWGAELSFAAFIGLMAILVLQAARRADIAIYFLGAHALLLAARAIWLGDPLAIPLHQMGSGS